jgi:hypothetical protein
MGSHFRAVFRLGAADAEVRCINVIVAGNANHGE